MFSDFYIHFIAVIILLTASAVISPLVSRNRKIGGTINFLFVAFAAVNIFLLAYTSIFQSAKPYTHDIIFFNMHIPIMIDGLSGFFMAIIALISVASSFYSIQYMTHYKEYGVFTYYSALPLFILGMFLLVSVDDLFIGFTVAWQLMTLTSFMLIKYENKIKENVKSARTYLILMELAWLLIIGGTLFIHGYSFGDPLHTITHKLAHTNDVYRYMAFGSILTGFAFKAGVFPLGQLWLPNAHSIAPSPVSALLSGVMLKTGIYGIMRTTYWMMPESLSITDAYVWGIIIAVIGVVTLFIGTAQSLKQHNMKRLLAYSSIGQIGYIVLAIGNGLILMKNQNPFMVSLAILSLLAALYHIVNHAIFKSLLFLTSGSVLYATDTKDLNKLGGLISFMPLTGIVAGVASLSIAGIPPFSGFVSKWSIIAASLLTGKGMVLIILFGIIALFTSALTLACYVKFFGMAFTSRGAELNCEKEIKEVPATLLIPKFFIGAVCILQGLFPALFIALFIKIFKSSQSAPFVNIVKTNALDWLHVSTLGSFLGMKVLKNGGVTVAAISPMAIIVILTVLTCIIVMIKKISASQPRTKDIWLCGYQEANNNNRYVDSSMFAALKKALWWTGGNPNPESNIKKQ